MPKQKEFREQLTPILDAIDQLFPTDISNLDDPNPIADYLSMLVTNPIIGAAFELQVLMMLGMLGKFSHPDEAIMDFVNKNFEQMEGSLSLAVSEMAIARAVGHSLSEIVITPKNDAWMLASLHGVDPRLFVYRGSKGRIDQIVYNGSYKSNLRISLKKFVHVVNGRHLSYGSPYGIASCRRALPSHHSWHILMNLMMQTAQTQPVPYLVGQADPRESVPQYRDDGVSPALDADGQQMLVNAVQDLQNKLSNLAANGVLATSLNSHVTTVGGGASFNFFGEALQSVERKMLQAFLVPETALQGSRSGLGDSSLADSQRTLLEDSIEAFVTHEIKENLLESVVRPLIEWNFGSQETYGTFERDEEGEQELDVANSILQSFATGAYKADDLEAINRLREIHGLPEASEIVEGLSGLPEYDEVIDDELIAAA